MNILHIMKDYKPNNGGSVVRNGNMIDNYTKMFDDNIIVLNLDGDKFDSHSFEDGVEVYRCTSLIKMLWVCLKIIKTNSIDIIQTHNFRFLLIGYISHLFNKKSRLSVELHAIYNMSRFKELLSYRILKKANLVTVLSESAKRYLVNEKGINASKIIVLRNGLNDVQVKLEDFDLAEQIKEIHQKYCIIAYTGSFIEWQGVKFLAECFDRMAEQIPNLFLLFLGDGKEFDYVSGKIESSRFSNRCIVHPGINKKQLNGIMSYVDIIIIPRKKNLTTNTAVPLKAIEAMQMGKCIVSSDDDGLTELLNKENAIIFEAYNSNDMIRKLKTVVNDKSLRLKLGNEAQKKAKSEIKSWHDNVLKLRKAYMKMK